MAVSPIDGLTVGHHLYHVDAQFFRHWELIDGICLRIGQILGRNAGQRVRFQVEMAGSHPAGVFAQVVPAQYAFVGAVVTVLQVRPVKVQGEAGKVSERHVQGEGITGIAHRPGADGQAGLQDAFPQVTHPVDALIVGVAFKCLLTNPEGTGRLLLPDARIEISCLDQIDLRTNGTLAVAGYQVVQRSDISRILFFINGRKGFEGLQMVQRGQHQGVFPLRTLFIGFHQSDTNIFYPFQHQ